MKLPHLAAMAAALGMALASPATAQCPADVNDDGVVDVIDALMVLGLWGPCSGCPGDLAPPGAPDGIIDVNDLMVLLGGWGGCDEPYYFLVVEEVSPAVAAVFPSYSAAPSVVIDGKVIDVNYDGIFDGPEGMEWFYALYVPPDYTGLICLDWEGPGLHALRSPPGSPAHTNAMNEFLECLAVAKALRPNAKTGFYAIPLRRYWNRNAQWIEETAALLPIINASDALFPSVYDFYRDGAAGPFHTPEDDRAYVRDNVEMALRFASGKPVYPYVWPRYHDSNELWAYRSIPRAELMSHTSAIFTAEYQGDRAAGLVWFGADADWDWLIQHFPDDPLSIVLDAVFTIETLPGETRAQYFDRTHTAVLQWLSEVVAAANAGQYD